MFLSFPAALSLLALSSTPVAVPRTTEDPPAPAEVRAVDVDAAALDGLMWLTRQQEEDGHWSLQGTFARCPAGFGKGKKDSGDYDLGLSGLALQALARARAAQEGRTPVAVVNAVDKGTSWLLAEQREDGSFAKRTFMYSHAIATHALVDVLRATHDAKVKAAVQKAVDYLQAAQRPSPTGKGSWGWRYASLQEVRKSMPGDAPDRELFDSDTSITAWCTGALRAAREAGLVVDNAALEGAVEYVRWVTNRDGNVGYLDPKGAGLTVTGVNDHYQYHPSVMNALAVLVRLDGSAGRGGEDFSRTTKAILADPPKVSDDHLTIDYYYWHHGAAALRRTRTEGGEAWANLAVGHLLALQDRTKGACSQGAWTTGDRWAYAGGTLYTTAINVLTLEDALGW